MTRLSTLNLVSPPVNGRRPRTVFPTGEIGKWAAGAQRKSTLSRRCGISGAISLGGVALGAEFRSGSPDFSCSETSTRLAGPS